MTAEVLELELAVASRFRAVERLLFDARDALANQSYKKTTRCIQAAMAVTTATRALTDAMRCLEAATGRPWTAIMSDPGAFKVTS